MSNQLERKTESSEVISKLVLSGDLSKMTDTQKVSYYSQFCESLGLNPLTEPFAILKLNGKENLYAKKDATDQLRKVHQVSIESLECEEVKGCYRVIAKAKDGSGKTDVSTGIVAIEGLKGEALANAMMKAETKAKRRVTLSICGLGMLDETEVKTIQNAVVVDAPIIPHEDLPNLAEQRDDYYPTWQAAVNLATTKDELMIIWNENKATCEADPKIKAMFTAKGKELK